MNGVGIVRVNDIKKYIYIFILVHIIMETFEDIKMHCEF